MTSWQLVRLFAGSFVLVSLLLGVPGSPLFVSTLLTLVVIPLLYFVAYRRKAPAVAHPSLTQGALT